MYNRILCRFQGYPHSDAVDEPLYRNLPSGGDATPSSPVNASANGGYENLESVVSSGANNSAHVNNSPCTANNIYQNQEAPGRIYINPSP